MVNVLMKRVQILIDYNIATSTPINTRAFENLD